MDGNMNVKISWCHQPHFDFQRGQEFWIFGSHSGASDYLCFLEIYAVTTGNSDMSNGIMPLKLILSGLGLFYPQINAQ
jgi:hypothetical protein